MDYIIKSIKIEGFWGLYTVQTEFNKNVNIFIGKNGAGKTTFINILKAVLTVDIPLIREQKFSKINIELMYKRKTRKIEITRKEGNSYPFEILRYRIGNNVFKFPLFINEYDYKHRSNRIHPAHKKTISQLKKNMEELVNVCWLSVHREILPESDIDEELWIEKKTPIDRRLDELMKQFTGYQLKLENKASECSNKFQRDVLTSTLFDEKLDHFDASKKDLQLVEEELLIHAFEELGVPLDVERIKRHVSEVDKSTLALNQFFKDKLHLTINDVLPLSLVKRTQHIIELSRDTESKKREIFKFRGHFLNLIHDFIEEKEFIFGSKGELLVKIRNSDRELKIEQLSSGEKQLLILLTETLLQENKPFIFIADEPELSLHIEWQEKLLSAIKSLNDNAQLIMATHSPEIVSEFGNSTFDMGSVFIE